MTESIKSAAGTHDSLLGAAGEASVPKPAATVVLIRDGENGLETWMMRRVSTMAFAAGAAVFPGGKVDPGDGDTTVAWTGSDPAAHAARMGTPSVTARELVQAALRELFEETGVLLASPVPSIDLERARVAVEKRELSLASLLSEHGSTLDAGSLHPWARWVTPPVEQRRYDTWFFVATLPPGAQARSVSSESDVASWMEPGQVIDAQARGERLVLPPTLAMLHSLASAGSVASVHERASDRSLKPVHPEVRRNADGGIDVLADGTLYPVVPPSSAL